MAYGTPTNPVAGTVITVAYAVANLLTQIRWLRQMLGNADPPGSSYVPVSSSTTAVSWSRIPTDALAAGAALGNIAAGTVTNAYLGNSSVDSRVLAPGAVLTSIGSQAIGNGSLATDSVDSRVLAASAVTNDTIATDAVTTAKIQSVAVTLAKMAADSVANANIIDGTIQGIKLAAGAAATNLGFPPVNSDSPLFSTFTQAIANGQSGFFEINSSQTDGPVPAQTFYLLQTCETNQPTNYVWQMAVNINDQNALYHRIVIAGAPGAWVRMWTAGNDGTGSGLDAGTLAGRTATATPSAGSIPVADASGRLDSWITGGGGGSGAAIPTGLGGWVPIASAIPTGWARYANANGRVLVGGGASSVGGITFTETGTGQEGTSWSHGHTDAGHAHTTTGHTHGSANLSVSGSTGGPSSTGTGGGVGATFGDGSHTHNQGTLDVAGATDSATVSVANGAASIGAVLWAYPTQSIVLITKT